MCGIHLISFCFVNNRGDDFNSTSEILQVIYHQSMHDSMIILYPRELLIFDLNIKQTIGVILLDKTVSPFNRVSFMNFMINILRKLFMRIDIFAVYFAM